MTRQDNPTYYSHVCEVIKAVLSAENRCISRGIVERFKAHEITADQYIEEVADELLKYTDPNKIPE